MSKKYTTASYSRSKEWWESDWDRWADWEDNSPMARKGRRDNSDYSPTAAGKGMTTSDIKLAVALRSARAMVSVLDTNRTEKMSVDFLSQDSKQIAATLLKAGKIFISAQPILDYPDDFSTAIHCVNGETVHEVGHSVGTRARLEKGCFPADTGDKARDLTVKTITNILEDNLIEREQLSINPGFKKHLDATFEWIEEQGLADQDGIKPWNEASVEERTGHLTQLLRYKNSTDKWKTIPSDVQDTLLDINHRYLNSRDSEKKGLILDTLDILTKDAEFEPPPPPDGSGEEEGEGEGQSGEGEEGEGQGKSTGNEKKGPKIINGLLGHQCLGKGTTEISQQQAIRIAELVEQEAEWHDRSKTLVTRPPVESPHPAKRTPEVNKLIGAIRARPTKFTKPASLQKSGTVDANNLHRIFYDPVDLRVFHRPIIAGKTWARIYLLADMSSSMNQELNTVYDCAVMMIYAFKDMKVATKVYGYTDHSRMNQIYRLWEPGDKMERLHIIFEQYRGGTPTGNALDWAVDNIMKESAGPEEKKLIIVLTDGAPNDRDLVKSVVTNANRRGISILEIAVNTFSEEMQRAMFGKNVIGYQYGGKSQTSKLAKWLSENM